ncbi:MAG: hypothetical protein MSH43_05105 [Bacteroidales bacterium]|nr:hypothetical protein [Bacteroidales bacterium]
MSCNHGGERYIKSFDGRHQSAYRHISIRGCATRCTAHLGGDQWLFHACRSL